MTRSVICIIAVMLLIGNIIRANEFNFTTLSNLDEYAITVPDLPNLPDEDEILYGDANDDGVVNVLDIIAIVNYIMGGNPDPFNFEAADVNNDGIINILDVIYNINVIMETPGMPCAGYPTVPYDGQTYNTVQIGDQCWLKENLNVGTMINSTTNGFQQTDNGVIEKYCYNNDITYCDTYGGLYEWPEAVQYVETEGAQGICPVGWHFPTDGEWTTLTDFLGGSSIAGGKMKSTGTIDDGTGHWHAPNIGATNSSGFTGLPGGYRNCYDGIFYYLSINGTFWSSSEYGTVNAWNRTLTSSDTNVNRNYDWEDTGYSIRCLKDD